MLNWMIILEGVVKKKKKRNWIRCEWDEKEIVLKMV